MGLSKIALNLAERAANYSKLLGKSSIIQTKPNNLGSIKNLKYNSLNQDICKFSSDSSLCPKFLDELRNIQGSGLEKIETITQKLFNKMGYKSPIKLVENNSQNITTANLNFQTGRIEISKKLYNRPNEVIISLLRHELDHVDKFAKLIKSEGIDNVMKAFNIENMSQETKTFWQNLAKNVNIEGFDSKKYMQALTQYKSPEQMKFNNPWEKFANLHIYCTNPLEESAYKIQKEVAQYYKIDDIVIPDVYGKRIRNIADLIIKHSENKNETIPKGFRGVQSFNNMYKWAKTLQEKNGLQILKNQDEKLALEISNKIKTPQSEIQALDKVYNWLKNEKFNLSDIISSL